MKLNSAQLEAFYVVAKTLHFTKAAEVLHVTQSALSQRIAKLEQDLECTLFIRDRTSIRLSEAGQQVLRFCQFNETAEGELLQKLKSSESGLAGSVRIAGFSSANRSILIPALRNLMQNNSELSIQLLTREVRTLQSLLRSSEVDYILTYKLSESPNIENIFLGFEENVLVRAKKSPDVEIYLDHDEEDTITKDFFSANKMPYKPKLIRYLDDVYGIIDGVKNGYGKAILPRHLIENEKDLEVTESKKVLWMEVYLQFFKQPFYRQAHQKIVADIKTYFGKCLSQKK